MIRGTILFALGWALAGAAPAAAECGTAGDAACFTNGASVEAPPPTLSKIADAAFYEWDESANVSTDDSAPFEVLVESVLFDFDPDRTTTGAPASGATIHVRRCVGRPATCDPNLCAPIHDAPLDGTEGGPSIQNKSVRAGPGRYCIDLVVAPPGAGDDPIVEIRAEAN